MFDIGLQIGCLYKIESLKDDYYATIDEGTVFMAIKANYKRTRGVEMLDTYDILFNGRIRSFSFFSLLYYYNIEKVQCPNLQRNKKNNP